MQKNVHFYLDGSEKGEHVGGDDDEAEAGAEGQEPEVEDHFHLGFRQNVSDADLRSL